MAVNIEVNMGADLSLGTLSHLQVGSQLYEPGIIIPTPGRARNRRRLTMSPLFLKLEPVRIITWRALRKFAEKRPAAERPLREWHRLTSLATWRSFSDVKATLGQSDQARVRSGQTVCVFDVGGNKFRLIAFISYATGKMYVLRLMTHKEYDKGNQPWKNEL